MKLRKIGGGVLTAASASGSLVVDMMDLQINPAVGWALLIFALATAIAGVALMVLPSGKMRQAPETPREGRMKVGKDSVVYGNIPHNSEIGDGSVVVGATDARGNTIFNTSMAVGRGAFAGPGSIAIGANASAGMRPTDKDQK
jgi:hypothetical protein